MIRPLHPLQSDNPLSLLQNLTFTRDSQKTISIIFKSEILKVRRKPTSALGSVTNVVFEFSTISYELSIQFILQQSQGWAVFAYGSPFNLCTVLT